MLHLGIVGCGRVTTMFHLKAIKEVNDIALVAVVDRHKPSMDSVKKICGADRGYCDFSDLLSDPEVDTVVINTPPQLHEEMVIQALQAGRHVLCEKPLATSVEGALRIKKAVESTGLVAMAVHNYAFTPSLEMARELVEHGSLGGVKRVSVRFENNLKGYGSKTDFRLRNEFGIVEDVLPHVLSVTQGLAGTATTVQGAECWKKSFEVFDNLRLSLKTDNDVELDCYMSWTKLIPSFRVVASCASGSVETDVIRSPYGVVVEKDGKRSRMDERKGLGIYVDLLRFKHPSFQNQYQHLCRVVEGAEEPRIGIDEEIAIIRMMQDVASYLSNSQVSSKMA